MNTKKENFKKFMKELIEKEYDILKIKYKGQTIEPQKSSLSQKFIELDEERDILKLKYQLDTGYYPDNVDENNEKLESDCYYVLELNSILKHLDNIKFFNDKFAPIIECQKDGILTASEKERYKKGYFIIYVDKSICNVEKTLLDLNICPNCFQELEVTEYLSIKEGKKIKGQDCKECNFSNFIKM